MGENSGNEIPMADGVGGEVGDGEAVVALKKWRVMEWVGCRWRTHGVS